MTRRIGLAGGAALAALLVLAASASAQITTASVTGTIKDTQGAIVPGVAVILISETRGTQLPDVFTNTNGDFTFANVSPDRYTLQVTMQGFKTQKRTGVVVSAGDRMSVGAIAIEVGGLTDTVQVKAESPVVQTTSGERSFTVGREAVENLPIANRSFMALAFLAPGVTMDGNNTPTRIGGGGDPNIMMDGVSAMDTGSNRPLLQMNVESIAEVKVLTSGYQAEYGRASGVQVTAVTKSGTNRFRGSVYDVQRDSKWYANSKTNKINGDVKPTLKEKDWGYSIGGPIGKPGGNNKLFFFYAQEFSPRTRGNDVVRYRFPTALERAGDFSQTTDNNGVLYPYIRDPQVGGACSAADQTACFRDGGVLGRIPQNRLYDVGLNILKLYPMPNLANPGTNSYNFELQRPLESALSYQPAVRLDYQPMQKLRATFKYSAWKQQDKVFAGTIPGFNDTRMQPAPVVSWTTSANYTVSPTTFLEATFGHSQNELAGCAQAQSGTGAIFCNNGAGSQGIPYTSASSLAANGLATLPFLFPNATVLPSGYYAVQALNQLDPPFWDGTRMSKVPTFQYGSRVANAPPTIGFPGWFNINSTNDFALSLTKVMGRHTFKTGFYNTHSYKAEQTSNAAFGTINFGQDTANPNDTSFGFANAATGTFASYTQAKQYVETNSIYNNAEWYIQDNWKVNNRLTLDYGFRFVHQGAQYDTLGQASNFLPDQWSLASAPTLYVPGCANNVYPCSGTNRQAINPVTGQFLGINTTSAFGTLVPNTGNTLNGLFLPGEQGLPKATYSVPALAVGPRFGAAYDVTGRQKVVLRGSAGMYFDRPYSSPFSGGVNNPPTSGTVTVQYSNLQTLGQGGLTTAGAPGLNAFPRDIKLPTSVQWNGGAQMTLPWAMAFDASYVGQHGYNLFNGVNINAVDFGVYFQPQAQDPTQTPTFLGSNTLPQNNLRAIRGYAGITEQQNRGWRTYHSIQLSLNRRFQNGLSFGFFDAIGLSDRQQSGARLQHNPDGTYSFRADQAAADDLLGQNNPVRNTLRGNFVWDLPDLKSSRPALRAIGLVLNDWQISGIWSGSRAGANVSAGNSAVPSGAYTVGYSYQNGGGSQNLTGSPDYGARIRVVGDPGKGCSSDPLRQFNTAAFQGPLVGSVGLESGTNYLHACFVSTMDLAIARNIRLGGARNIQLRLDLFNAFNQSAITARNTSLTLTSPTDPITPQNLPFDANGNVIDSRSRPRGAGFGVATGYQAPRNIQAQIRFAF
ncbi:MAG: carboxypeptidase-like regulatory domain-containing protein [Acidobacteriota bacterium]